MATAISLQNTKTLNSNSNTLTSEWANVYSKGAYNVYCKVSCTFYYYDRGKYTIGPITVNAKTSSTSWSVTVGRLSWSLTGATNFSSTNFNSGSSAGPSDLGSERWLATIGTDPSGTIDASSTTKSSTKRAWAIIKCSMGVAHPYNGSTTSSTIEFSINIENTVQGAMCRLYYLKEDGSQYGGSVTGYYWGTTSIINGYTKSGYTDTGSGTYTISYNTNGGTAVSSKALNWSYSQPITYSFHDWGGYTPGSTYTFLDETKSLKASFVIEGGTRTWRYPTLGSAATVYTNKKGYKKTNVWYYSNDVAANSSDTITSSQTLHCVWEPQVYKVSFNLNGGKMPEDYGKPADYTFEKTYGVSQQLPQWEPTRVGYTFAGWSNADGSISPQSASANMDDRVYNSLYTEYTTGNVILYAKWNLNPNTVIFNYYIINSQGTEVAYVGNNADRETYNITQTKYQKYSPTHASEMTGDYVFLGWCDEKPSNWDNSEYINRGYHGVYTLPTDAPSSELPVEVDISKLNKLEDWGGAPEQYYGIWTKTGKYIMVGSSYKKVNTAYVKISGSWKPITDIWVKINDTWKHEI